MTRLTFATAAVLTVAVLTSSAEATPLTGAVDSLDAIKSHYLQKVGCMLSAQAAAQQVPNGLAPNTRHRSARQRSVFVGLARTPVEQQKRLQAAWTQSVRGTESGC